MPPLPYHPCHNPAHNVDAARHVNCFTVNIEAITIYDLSITYRYLHENYNINKIDRNPTVHFSLWFQRLISYYGETRSSQGGFLPEWLFCGFYLKGWTTICSLLFATVLCFRSCCCSLDPMLHHFLTGKNHHFLL